MDMLYMAPHAVIVQMAGHAQLLTHLGGLADMPGQEARRMRHGNPMTGAAFTFVVTETTLIAMRRGIGAVALSPRPDFPMRELDTMTRTALRALVAQHARGGPADAVTLTASSVRQGEPTRGRGNPREGIHVTSRACRGFPRFVVTLGASVEHGLAGSG